MKYFLVLSLLVSTIINAYSQTSKKGRIVTEHFVAPSIQDNPGGENPMRSLTIYLPFNYDSGKDRYPVIYYLHGYTFNDSTTIAWLELKELMDRAIEKGIIPPVIVAVPDSYTRFGGSFYANSSLTGNWADFIGKDVVGYVDRHFRTIPDRNSRGVTGISMGGHGSIKMGMLFPDVFGSIYACTPVMLNWSDALNPGLSIFKVIDAHNEKEIGESFSARLMIDLARTWSPNPGKPLFYADFPAAYNKDSLIVNISTVQRWSANFPTLMIEDYLPALKSLRAFKMDWGRNDENQQNLVLCMEFSKKLEHYGVKHFAEEYLGGHADQLPGPNGRVYTEVLPFFATWLNFNGAGFQTSHP